MDSKAITESLVLPLKKHEGDKEGHIPSLQTNLIARAHTPRSIIRSQSEVSRDMLSILPTIDNAPVMELVPRVSIMSISRAFTDGKTTRNLRSLIQRKYSTNPDEPQDAVTSNPINEAGPVVQTRRRASSVSNAIINNTHYDILPRRETTIHSRRPSGNLILTPIEPNILSIPMSCEPMDFLNTSTSTLLVPSYERRPSNIRRLSIAESNEQLTEPVLLPIGRRLSVLDQDKKQNFHEIKEEVSITTYSGRKYSLNAARSSIRKSSIAPIIKTEEYQETMEPVAAPAAETVIVSARKSRVAWIRCAFKGLMILLLQKERHALHQIVQTKAAAQIPGGFLSRLIKDRKNNEGLVNAVKDLLDGNRTPAKIEQLSTILSINLKGFNRYSAQQRAQFCQIMTFERFPAEAMLVREGHISCAFYFILGGQVEVFKIKEGEKFVLANIYWGESFGDRTMNLLNDKRTACVASTKESALLQIDKSEYFRIVNVKDEKSVNNVMLRLSKLPIFANSLGGFLEKIAMCSELVRYDARDVILVEGTQSNKLYWILSGTCKCVRAVPFIKSKDNSALKEFTSGHKLKDNEEVIHQLLTVCDMETPQFFPSIPLPTFVLDELGRKTFDHLNFVSVLEDDDPRLETNWTFASIIASTKTEIAVVKRSDFVRFATEPMLLELFSENHPFNVPLSELSKVYLSALEWKSYKTKIRNDIVKQHGTL